MPIIRVDLMEGRTPEMKENLIAALCEAARVPCVFHCAHDLGLKTAAMLHVVASSPGFTLANDCTYYGLEGDIITPEHAIEGGFMKVPEGYGLGVTVDVAKLAKYRVEDAAPGGS